MIDNSIYLKGKIINNYMMSEVATNFHSISHARCCYFSLSHSGWFLVYISSFAICWGLQPLENFGINQVNIRLHCEKSVQIRIFYDPYFPVFGLNTEIYFAFGHFLRSAQIKQVEFSFNLFNQFCYLTNWTYTI